MKKCFEILEVCLQRNRHGQGLIANLQVIHVEKSLGQWSVQNVGFRQGEQRVIEPYRRLLTLGVFAGRLTRRCGRAFAGCVRRRISAGGIAERPLVTSIPPSVHRRRFSPERLWRLQGVSLGPFQRFASKHRQFEQFFRPAAFGLECWRKAVEAISR